MLVCLSGDNSYLLKRELKDLIRGFIKVNGELSVEQIDAEETDKEKLQGSLTGMDLFSTRKMVVLRNLSKNKDLADAFEQIIKNVPESTDIVFVEPDIDKRTSLFKTLKKLTDFKEFNKLDPQSLVNWAVKKVKDEEGEISVGDARYLIDRAGANQQMLDNELDKLLLFDKKITRDNIDLLVELTPQSSIFQLLDAAFAGDHKRAMELYKEQRAMKAEPQQIIAMIAWQLHIVALIKASGERSMDQVAAEAKLSPYSVNKSRSISNRLTSQRLRELIKGLLKIDFESKRKKMDLDAALERYLISL